VAGAYAQLPQEGANEAALGGAFISLVEPHAGYELAYTRWYEDDHFYAGAMTFPWWFSGRRWIATSELRAQRVPAASSLDAGWSLATYWITAGRLRDQARWLEATVARLRMQERMFDQRTHVMTGFFEPVASWSAPGHGPRALHALDYPYAGVVLELLDAPSAARRPDLLSWLGAQHVPHRLAGGGVAQCVCFAPLPWPGDGETSWFDYAAPQPERLALLWFLLGDPRSEWGSTFALDEQLIHDGGQGQLEFAGGFIPALPGSDQYLDELR
jgi:hypothetical protein